MGRAGGIAKSRFIVASVAAAALLSLVAWRGGSDVTSASHAWLGATIALFAVTFLRVPSHLYWRGDAALLAQLPIGGGALLDVALVRCIGSAGAATGVVLVGALPLLALDPERVGAATRALATMPIAGDPVSRLTPALYFWRHAALACALGVIAAALIPAVATWSATLVATGRGKRALRTATALAGTGSDRGPRPADVPQNSDAALLGAVPGAAASAAIVVILLVSPWLQNRDSPIPALVALAAIVVTSFGSLIAIRAASARAMPAILREMSALDRQQLATLELNPPTAIERGIASLLGASAVSFRKDARLMRRRYPMAFALGALAFAVLAAIGWARPASESWLIAVLVAATGYAAVLAGRLWRPPIELPQLRATLPVSGATTARAKLAWLASWMLLFVAAPAAFVWLAGQ